MFRVIHTHRIKKRSVYSQIFWALIFFFFVIRTCNRYIGIKCFIQYDIVWQNQNFECIVLLCTNKKNWSTFEKIFFHIINISYFYKIIKILSDTIGKIFTTYLVPSRLSNICVATDNRSTRRYNNTEYGQVFGMGRDYIYVTTDTHIPSYRCYLWGRSCVL